MLINVLAGSALAYAIVAQDQISLRAAPRDGAQAQAVLWQGDMLEVRADKLDYWQVYDHRRERAGYVKASQLRRISLKAEDSADTLAVVRFLRDTPGAESLGLSYAAAWLKAASPAQTAAIGGEAFDAIGTMAERLARRASSRLVKPHDAVVAAHLEVVAQYGVVVKGYERDGRMHLCYDGEAYRRVLAFPSASQAQKARAALGLTRHDCIDPAMPALARFNLDQWRGEVLERVEVESLPGYLKNRIKVRRAGVWSALAYAYRRQASGEKASSEAGQRALTELAGVNKTELTDEDIATWADAAVRVGASRWAAEAGTLGAPGVAVGSAKPGLSIVTRSGQPGETCVALVDAKHDQQNPLIQRCTWGVVWPASSRANAAGSALTLAVQPLAGWRELWVFQNSAQGWRVDVLPPASSDPEVGYAEFAGWVPGANKMLVTREAKVEGRIKTRFELINIETLQVENGADKPDSLSVFYRWQDAVWKRQTVALR
jgi:hypothetical protein